MSSGSRRFSITTAMRFIRRDARSVRGNMKAVVQAVLLDPEARGDVKTDPSYGKLREPAQYIIGVLRALNVKSFNKTSTSDGVLGSRSTADFTGSLDQPIFQPATVFSYYQPGYEVPGIKITGPAFGILSTATTLRRANNVNTLIYTGVSSNTTPTALSPDRPRGTSVDLSNLEALATTPISNAGSTECPDASRYDVHANAHLDNYGHQLNPDLGRKLCSQARADGGLPGGNLVAVRHPEINIMATSRRDFLRTSACALGRHGRRLNR